MNWLTARTGVVLINVVLCLFCAAAQGAYIQRTITVDGSMTDWYDPTLVYVPPGDITNNTGQFSNDAIVTGGDLDSPQTSTGRDLKKFSFTWDNTNLYFYVERWASATNVTDWWFYIDHDDGLGGGPDGLMQTGEKVLRIKWQGSNRSTVAEIWDYSASASGGDPLTNAGVGDGYTMPGTLTNQTSYYSNNSGASSGTEMEAYIAWSQIGLSGPANIRFHISSSNGSNIPSNIIDNMDGPAGGQLFPQDLQVSKSASVTSIKGNLSFTYTVEVYNASINTFNNVVISDTLPSEVVYDSHVAQAGTTFDDSGDADTDPDQWNIPSIPANTTYSLTVTVIAGIVTSLTTATNTATLTASDETDQDSSNDSASVDVDIIPVPNLTMVKFASGATVNPGANITYSVNITNTGGDDAYSVIIDDHLSPFVMFRLNTYGAGQHFQFNEGTPASGLSIGTVTFSNNDGATWTYSPVSGGGGAPAGYDANVTNWKIDMSGTMNASNSNFNIQYQVQVE